MELAGNALLFLFMWSSILSILSDFHSLYFLKTQTPREVFCAFFRIQLPVYWLSFKHLYNCYSSTICCWMLVQWNILRTIHNSSECIVLIWSPTVEMSASVHCYFVGYVVTPSKRGYIYTKFNFANVFLPKVKFVNYCLISDIQLNLLFI